MSAYFRDRLFAMEFKEDPKINVLGLAIGVDVGDEDYADEILERCRRRGLLLTTQDSVLMLLPALTINRTAAKRGLDILESCLSS